MPTPGDKKVRPVLTLPQIYSVHQLLEESINSDPDAPVEWSEVAANFKFLLLKEEFGMLKGIGTVGVPRPAPKTMSEQLGFAGTAGAGSQVRREKTQEEIEEEMFQRIHEASEKAQATLNAGGKLPRLSDLFIDPEFKFNKD